MEAWLPAHSTVLGEDGGILGNNIFLALLTLFTSDCSCLVPLLPGAAAPHPQYHRHCVALLFLLPPAQVSLSDRGCTSHPQDAQTSPPASLCHVKRKLTLPTAC